MFVNDSSPTRRWSGWSRRPFGHKSIIDLDTPSGMNCQTAKLKSQGSIGICVYNNVRSKISDIQKIVGNLFAFRETKKRARIQSPFPERTGEEPSSTLCVTLATIWTTLVQHSSAKRLSITHSPNYKTHSHLATSEQKYDNTGIYNHLEIRDIENVIEIVLLSFMLQQ